MQLFSRSDRSSGPNPSITEHLGARKADVPGPIERVQPVANGPGLRCRQRPRRRAAVREAVVEPVHESASSLVLDVPLRCDNGTQTTEKQGARKAEPLLAGL